MKLTPAENYNTKKIVTVLNKKEILLHFFLEKKKTELCPKRNSISELVLTLCFFPIHSPI